MKTSYERISLHYPFRVDFQITENEAFSVLNNIKPRFEILKSLCEQTGSHLIRIASIDCKVYGEGCLLTFGFKYLPKIENLFLLDCQFFVNQVCEVDEKAGKKKPINLYKIYPISHQDVFCDIYVTSKDWLLL